MSLPVRIGVCGLGLSIALAALGNLRSADAQGAGGEPALHPLLTENEYRLVAEQSQKAAALRSQRKQLRVAELTERLARARAEANTALQAQLGAVLARLEVGGPPLSEQERWSRNHGRRMMLRGLWTNYGKQLHQPAVVAEFDAHAWRMARLERAIQVATHEPDPARRARLAGDVDALMSGEGERHRGVLKELLQPPASVPTAVPAVVASTAAPPFGAVVPPAASPSIQTSVGEPNQ